MASQMLSLKVNTFKELLWQGEAGVPRKCSPFPSCLSCQNDKFQSQKLCIGYWGIVILRVSSRKGKEKKNQICSKQKIFGKNQKWYLSSLRTSPFWERKTPAAQARSTWVVRADCCPRSSGWEKHHVRQLRVSSLPFPICPNNHPREIRGKQLGW